MTVRVIGKTEADAQKKLLAALSTEAAPAAAEVKEKTESEKKDSMLDALTKYIPVTVIIGYTFLDTVFRSLDAASVVLAWTLCFVVLLIGGGALTYLITSGPAVDIAAMVTGNATAEKIFNDWQQVIANQRIKQSVIAMIAFTGYVMSIGGPFPSLHFLNAALVWQPYYGSIALVFATLLIALIAAKDLLAE